MHNNLTGGEFRKIVALPHGPDSMTRGLRRAATLPTILLMIALATVFLLESGADGFQSGHHGFLSSHGLTIAAHLSPEHRLLMFNKMSLDENGAVQYDAYNRFPIGAFAAIRLVTLPFRDSLSGQMLAARLLMTAFLAAAACLAYLSLLRLTGSRWAALSATLLAFSSYYCLHYGDMTFNDIPALFGLLLTFHGLVVFAQDGRFEQVLIKSLVAVFLGWQVYALLVPFVLFSCAREVVVSHYYASCSQEPPFHAGRVVDAVRRLHPHHQRGRRISGTGCSAA